MTHYSSITTPTTRHIRFALMTCDGCEKWSTYGGRCSMSHLARFVNENRYPDGGLCLHITHTRRGTHTTDLPWNRLWIRENSFGHYLCITRSPGCIQHEFGIKQCLTLRVFRSSDVSFHEICFSAFFAIEFWMESCFMAENIWWVVRWRMDCRGVAFVGHMLESFMRNFSFNERRDWDGLG